MRVSMMLMVVLLGLTGCKRKTDGKPDPAAQGQVPPKKVQSTPAWESEYDKMVSAIGLNQDESQCVRAAFEVREAEVGKWLKGERGVRLRQLEGEMKVAAKGGDLAETRRIISEAGGLRQELRKLLDSHQAKIMGSLTPEQQTHWCGHEIAEKLLDLMAPLKLDPEQQKRIREVAPRVVAKATRTGQANPRAAAYLELEKGVEIKVLTDVQREAYKGLKKTAPLRSLRK
ncbi:MAG: hypothetical protein KAI66_21755 [Lentisphaeria bacterium]|nr:hypothetical protein [Lentisphaeria bacterium]